VGLFAKLLAKKAGTHSLKHMSLGWKGVVVGPVLVGGLEPGLLEPHPKFSLGLRSFNGIVYTVVCIDFFC